MKKEVNLKTAFGLYLGFLAVIVLTFVAGIVGWILNIIRLCEATFDPLTGIVVLRIIGVFVAPIGMVLGFI